MENAWTKTLRGGNLQLQLNTACQLSCLDPAEYCHLEVPPSLSGRVKVRDFVMLISYNFSMDENFLASIIYNLYYFSRKNLLKYQFSFVCFFGRTELFFISEAPFKR